VLYQLSYVGERAPEVRTWTNQPRAPR
jgi:hypothetical protein